MGKIIGVIILCVVVSGATIFVYSTYAAAKSYAETRERFIREIGAAKTDLDQRLAFERARAVANSTKSVFDLNKSKADEGQPIDSACLWTAQGYRENATSNPPMAGVFQGMWDAFCAGTYGDHISDYGANLD